MTVLMLILLRLLRCADIKGQGAQSDDSLSLVSRRPIRRWCMGRIKIEEIVEVGVTTKVEASVKKMSKVS